MSKSILVGYADTPQSNDAVCLAEGLAAAGGAKLVLARVEPAGPYDLIPEELEEGRRAASEHMDVIARDLRARGHRVEIADLAYGSPAGALRDMAEGEPHDLIVVGSSHRGRAGTVLAGTVGLQILHGALCPVAIAPRGLADHEKWRPATIGVAYDGSPEAHTALDEARSLARGARATLEVVAVANVIGATHESVDPEKYRREARVEAHAWLEEAGHALRSDFTVVTRLAAGDPGPELLTLSKRLDLLVVGSRGYGPVRRILLGSVSSYLTTRCRCPLLVTPRGSRGSGRPDATTAEPATT